MFAAALAALLEADGRVETIGRARNGQEAIALAETLHPDAVLMDLAMPVMDGAEAARQLAKLLPEIRVVLVSSSPQAGDPSRVVASTGASAFVSKGRASEELVAAVLLACGRDGLVA
jgi:DNA-binding NarL/FixJ family response regulator